MKAPVMVSLALVAFSASFAEAQGRARTIIGQVLDSASQRPVRNAVVQLDSSEDRTSSDSAGAFRFSSRYAGRFRTLRVRAVGYRQQLVPLPTRTLSDTIDLGRIVVTASPIRLTDDDMLRHRVSFDSLTLQRTPCLGACPAFVLHVPAKGRVQFVSHNRQDMGRTSSQPITEVMVRRIEQVLMVQQFLALPEIRVGEEPYCRHVATDAPTITVTVFQQKAVRTRRYYMGCARTSGTDTLPRSLIRRMQVIADSIEAVAAAHDWIRPATRR